MQYHIGPVPLQRVDTINDDDKITDATPTY